MLNLPLRPFCGLLAAVLSPILTPALPAQETVKLSEAFFPGYQYHVSTRVELSGTLTLPPAKPQEAAKPLPISGTSSVDYDERVVGQGTDGQVQKALRIYRRIEFQRKLGDQPQQSTLRPAVRRLVILRHQNAEVPFSPDGPLTWGEIDLVRTDVFTPALAGLLPDRPVRPGDRWTATPGAVQELTDLEKIEEGRVECRFEQLDRVGQRRLVRVGLTGTVRGVNEDGPNRQTLDGYYYFDLESNHLSYLSLKGATALLDKDGKVAGSVEGRFVLTRQAHHHSPDLGDEVVRGLVLEPNAENTQLLYDNPELGVRFLHPRRWRVGAVRGRQITVDETGGSGLLLTLEPPAQVPTGAQFLAETRAWLQQQKATVLRIDPPRPVQAAPQELEQFAVDAEQGGQRVLLDYFVVRQASGGATLAARLLAGDQANLRREVEQIARSVRLGR